MTGELVYDWLSRDEWAALRWIAHNAAEDRDARDGWCRWGIPAVEPDWKGKWEWNVYKRLVYIGLVERRETWQDVLLKPTDRGWAVIQGQETQA